MSLSAVARTCGVIVLVLGLAACQSQDTASPKAQRRSIFKEMTKSRESLLRYASGEKPFDPDHAIRDAEALQRLSRLPWPLFPRSAAGASDARRAKEAVWQRPAEFNSLARRLETDSDALLAVAQTRSLSALGPAIHKLEASCDRCHDEFRRF